MRTVTAREASQAYSRILREAESGGQPVAIIAPYRGQDSHDRAQTIEHIVALMRDGLPLGGKRSSRDEMHER
jgi:antitoxin (DNA-binding transcriptional repressor) of toxin-antitoxin stability system